MEELIVKLEIESIKSPSSSDTRDMPQVYVFTSCKHVPSQTLPMEVHYSYCGRVYLLIEVSNPDGSFTDPDMTNNKAAFAFTVNCDQGKEIKSLG